MLEKIIKMLYNSICVIQVLEVFVRVGVKALFCFIILFALIEVLFLLKGQTLFRVVEKNLYKPAVLRTMDEHLDKLIAIIDTWHEEKLKAFSAFSNLQEVKENFGIGYKSKDTMEYEAAIEKLLTDTVGLKGIRIIDPKTGSLLFSSFKSDIVAQKDAGIAYKTYNAANHSIPIKYFFNTLDTPEILLDAESNSFVYSLPFYTVYDNYRGKILFYLSTKALTSHLFTLNKLQIADNVQFIHDDDFSFKGVALGLPYCDEDTIKKFLLTEWESGNFNEEKTIQANNISWIVLSGESKYGACAQFVPENLFIFSRSSKGFLLIVGFVTIFLFCFLLINIRRDPLTKIKTGIEHFYNQIVQDFFKEKQALNRQEIQEKMLYRRREIDAEFKNGISRTFLIKHEKEIDALLNKEWENMVSILTEEKKEKPIIIENTQHIYADDENRLVIQEVFENDIPELESVEDLADEIETAGEKNLLHATMNENTSLEATNNAEQPRNFSEDSLFAASDADEVTYLPKINTDSLFISPYFDKRATVSLEAVGEAEAEELIDLSSEDSIISMEDGLFAVKPKENSTNLDKDFKALVDSIL